jgi:hypothetical protein
VETPNFKNIKKKEEEATKLLWRPETYLAWRNGLVESLGL